MAKILLVNSGEPGIMEFFFLVKNYTKPVFGICAGHHIVGFMYGAKLLRSEEPELGDFELKIIKHHQLFNELPKCFTVRQMHNDSITVPRDFQLLAVSKTCKNQLMKHQNKALYNFYFLISPKVFPCACTAFTARPDGSAFP